MSHSLPPLKALRAFESAGRQLSFRKAALELHVTPAAISHQIKLLEDLLGVVLFRRLTRRIQLTEAGQRLLPGITDGFSRLVQSVDGLRSHRRRGTLSICVPPLFASKWLMPRLHDFVDAFPDIDLRVSTSMRLVDTRKDGAVAGAKTDLDRDEHVDIAVRFGSGKYPRCCTDKLFDVTFTPLCSPTLPNPSRPLDHPTDLAHYPLLHDDLHHVSDGWANWALWFEAAGIENLARKRGPHFSQPLLGLDAAADGAGVVLGAKELAGLDIAAGRLIAPFPIEVKTGAAYYVVCCEEEVADPAIKAFRTWLMGLTRKQRGRKPASTGRRAAVPE